MKTAGNLLLVLLSLLAVFHILVILGIFPYEQTWGGTVVDDSQVLIYEGFALFMTLVFMLIVGVKLNYLKSKSLKRVANIGLWAMVGFFTMSLIGNLTAKSEMERAIFIPVSLLLLLLTLRLAVGKRR
nr:hypothetical protein [uncultured Allomuricauda sp.]